jgi:Ca2+-transporting ATPase
MAEETSVSGLTQAEADRRLKAEGYNELPRQKRRTPLRIAVDVLREPMFGLLIVSGLIYLALGDPGEALVLLIFATASASIAVIQESRAERVLEALTDLTSPRALVIRDGERRRIPGREVVRDDIIIIAEGDRIPADGILLAGSDIQTDESLLTGEAVPVRKISSDRPDAGQGRPGGDDLPYLFSGTLVVSGQGTARVHHTGFHTEIGRIGVTLQKIDTEPARLVVQTRKLVRYFGVVGIVLSVVAILLYGVLRGDWLAALLGGIALSMSMLPEEFPLVLNVFMAMGAWRISRAKVLTRRAAAIETLGAATVLCTDKTGTLTENRMTIGEIWTNGGSYRPASGNNGPVDPAIRRALSSGILASKQNPFDPLEKAFHQLGIDLEEKPPAGIHLAKEYGLSPALLAMTHVWEDDDSSARVIAAKGAPEAIGRLCRLDKDALTSVQKAGDEMAVRGMRVLAVAEAAHSGPLPEHQSAFEFKFLGLVGLTDPLRKTVPAAIEECRSAGIRVIMITGDYPVTARAIAGQAGISNTTVISGDELSRMDDHQLADSLRTASVFARIMPEQKLRIVNALKANGEIVGMTGDGVNDAPSLKAAHIGVAMGGRGTDVAREASSIVLLDDDFASIVRTIRLGRRIYDNLRKAMGYILAVHVPIAGLALLPLALGWPMVLTPVHIAFLEMVIDPMCSIVFEAEKEEDDVMRRPPRDPDSPIFSPALIGWSLVQGFAALLMVAATYVWAVSQGLTDNEVRSLAFVSLVVVNIALVFVNRSFSARLGAFIDVRNRALWLCTAIALSLLALVTTWPPAQTLFSLGPLHVNGVVVSLGAAVFTILILELAKPFWRNPLRG